jgi:hypothetical protein
MFLYTGLSPSKIVVVSGDAQDYVSTCDDTMENGGSEWTRNKYCGRQFFPNSRRQIICYSILEISSLLFTI